MKVGNDYGTFTGTSAATPHVTGAIALIYAVTCPQFIHLAKTNPPQAALTAKQFIIEGTKPNQSLQTMEQLKQVQQTEQPKPEEKKEEVKENEPKQ